MTFLEALKKLRDDLKLWTTNNLNTKVDKVDNSLTTTDKTIVGAINELNNTINKEVLNDISSEKIAS
jgi:hypothetical protein